MEWVSTTQRYPEDNERVLIFDAKYGEEHVGWNAWRHTIGGKSSPGKWILPMGDADDMDITHWAYLPEQP